MPLRVIALEVAHGSEACKVMPCSVACPDSEKDNFRRFTSVEFGFLEKVELSIKRLTWPYQILNRALIKVSQISPRS